MSRRAWYRAVFSGPPAALRWRLRSGFLFGDLDTGGFQIGGDDSGVHLGSVRTIDEPPKLHIMSSVAVLDSGLLRLLSGPEIGKQLLCCYDDALNRVGAQGGDSFSGALDLQLLLLVRFLIGVQCASQ